MMICILASSTLDAQDFMMAHPDLKDKNYVIVTPDNYKERMANLLFSKIIYTENFLAVPNQNEIWLQARSRARRDLPHRSRK